MRELSSSAGVCTRGLLPGWSSGCAWAIVRNDMSDPFEVTSNRGKKVTTHEIESVVARSVGADSNGPGE
jgi:hypothetical protein